MITLGQIESINATLGEALQIRPKAANSRILCDAIGPDGELIRTNPRGYYLRTQFTQRLLHTHFF